ncbi:MAG: aldehyde dehydrogenase [Planctomycetes bacterium]|nr:aldehyde dehydrogenase [Planctomycetota bacterium]
MSKNIVHVVGTGTIGEPLIGMLTHFKEQLGIDEVTFNKRTPLKTDRSKVVDLLRRGARLATGKDQMSGFEKMDCKADFETEEAIMRASVVIDCTPSGAGLANKEQYYTKAAQEGGKGYIAQGSEFGFGKMYARGINDDTLQAGEDKFIHVVSCNTHNLAALINMFAIEHGNAPENMVSADFVCMRRANDVSQDDGYIASPEAGKHKDENFGTHHARDAYHLYKTKGWEFTNLFSSAIKVPTQYMHMVRFHLKVQQETSVEKLIAEIKKDDRQAITYKKSANQVFSFGRDHGFFGRILNQTVIPHEALTVIGGKDIYGFCFTPQDGNSLLSSMAAATWLLDPSGYEERIQCVKPYFFPEV